MSEVRYPYMPDGRMIQYVLQNNAFIFLAKAFAQAQSLDAVMPGAAVVVKNQRVIGIGANGSDYHKANVCQRVVLGCKSGQGYESCEGCHPKNHSERTAIKAAKTAGYDTKGADLYLWGHWWCCEPCWREMIEAGIENVYLLEGSEVLFNKDHPGNIVGRQFQSAS